MQKAFDFYTNEQLILSPEDIRKNLELHTEYAENMKNEVIETDTQELMKLVYLCCVTFENTANGKKFEIDMGKVRMDGHRDKDSDGAYSTAKLQVDGFYKQSIDIVLQHLKKSGYGKSYVYFRSGCSGLCGNLLYIQYDNCKI